MKSVPVLPRSPGRRAILGVAAVAVVLAAAAVGSLYTRSFNDEAVPPPTVSAPAQQIAKAARVPSASAPGYRVYVVASEEQAALVFAGIRDANDILANSAMAPVAHAVVVLTADLPAGGVFGAVEEANRLVAVGSAQGVVVDLR